MILQGDCIERLRELPDQSIHCCVTSPPYWGLRDYGVDGQIGLEETPAAFVAQMIEVFREVRRVLRDDGTLWLNLGDSYAGSNKGRWGDGNGNLGETPMQSKARTSGKLEYQAFDDGLKPKDLVGIPWRVALALQADGWYLRSDIIWSKPNPMPESVTDRPTKSHEYIFLLSKSERYFYNHEAIKEPITASSAARLAQDIENQRGSDRGNGGGKTNGPMKAVKSGNKDRKYGEDRDRPGSHLGASIPWEGTMRNKRTVWEVSTAIFSEAHFATFPPKLIEPCVLAGSPQGGIVLDPFFGSGTTGLVAMQNFREIIGIELNPEYIEIAKRRLSSVQMKLQLQEG